MLFSLTSALVALVALPRSGAWVASVTPSYLNALGTGEADITDVNNRKQPILDPDPGCVTFAATLTAGPFPLQQTLYVTGIYDRNHDENPSAKTVGNGCLGCANGCCIDAHGRSGWTHIQAPRTGVSDNYCVPKGFRSEDDNDCSAEYLSSNGTQYCMPHPPSANVNETQGDCYFTHEVVLTNVKPTKCVVETYDVAQRGAGVTAPTTHTLTIMGNDADVPAAGLGIYFRRHVKPSCQTWIDNAAEFEVVRSVEQCSNHLHLAACQLDDKAPAGQLSGGWIDEGEGIGPRCAGHRQAACSGRQVTNALEHRCRVTGCTLTDGVPFTATHRCDACDLLLTTNYPLTNSSLWHPLTDNDCSSAQHDDDFVVAFMAIGSPDSTASDVDTLLDTCCLGDAHKPAADVTEPPTEMPTTSGVTDMPTSGVTPTSMPTGSGTTPTPMPTSKSSSTDTKTASAASSSFVVAALAVAVAVVAALL